MVPLSQGDDLSGKKKGYEGAFDSVREVSACQGKVLLEKTDIYPSPPVFGTHIEVAIQPRSLVSENKSLGIVCMILNLAILIELHNL